MSSNFASLARGASANGVQTTTTAYTKVGGNNSYNGCGGGVNFVWILVWFFIVAVIVWILLYFIRPSWVQTTVNGQPTGNVDNGKAILWAIIVALIVAILIWIVWAWAY